MVEDFRLTTTPTPEKRRAASPQVTDCVGRSLSAASDCWEDEILVEVKRVVPRSDSVDDVCPPYRPRTSDVRVKTDPKDQEVPCARFRVGLHLASDGWSRHVRACDDWDAKRGCHFASRRSGLTRDEAARNSCPECRIGVDRHRGDAHGLLRPVHEGQVGVAHFT